MVQLFRERRIKLQTAFDRLDLQRERYLQDKQDAREAAARGRRRRARKRPHPPGGAPARVRDLEAAQRRARLRLDPRRLPGHPASRRQALRRGRPGRRPLPDREGRDPRPPAHRLRRLRAGPAAGRGDPRRARLHRPLQAVGRRGGGQRGAAGAARRPGARPAGRGAARPRGQGLLLLLAVAGPEAARRQRAAAHLLRGRRRPGQPAQEPPEGGRPAAAGSTWIPRPRSTSCASRA